MRERAQVLAQVDQLNIRKWMYESVDHQDVIDTRAANDALLEGSGKERGELWFGIDDLSRYEVPRIADCGFLEIASIVRVRVLFAASPSLIGHRPG